MAKQSLWMCFALILILAILASQAVAFTDGRDVTALEDFYEALNGPPQLKGWRLDGGDPCGESWAGLSCSGSSVIHLKLQGLNLSGYLSAQLYNMLNLKTLDVSSNCIVGEIPYILPPNATHMNLSHNLLSGPVGNVFTSLQNLRELDLSYNNLTGSLTSSFGSLTNLTRLFLQNNNFTGSVDYLAVLLPLTDMKIQDNENYFDLVIPGVVSLSTVLQKEEKSKIMYLLFVFLAIGLGIVLASNIPKNGKLPDSDKELAEKFVSGGYQQEKDGVTVEGRNKRELAKNMKKLERRKKPPSPPKKQIQLPCQQPDEDFGDHDAED
ncbi:hypothetical protein ACE6H2_010346 [Prunus campanulata]